MVETLLLTAAFGATYLGLSLLALRQRSHFRAVLGHAPGVHPSATPPAGLLPWGITCLCAGFCCSLLAQGPSFGSLLWVLGLAAMGVAVTFTLTWRPRWLSFVLRFGGL
jgi:hypothetical protein